MEDHSRADRSGHKWERIGESEVRTRDSATGKTTKKTEVLWVCEKCSSETVLDSGKDPERESTLYSREPMELDGTTINEPEIPSCDVVIAKKG
jgi:hypothetical protein